MDSWFTYVGSLLAFLCVEVNNFNTREVVVAQLAEWSLTIPEDPGSNPVIVNIVNCLLKDENKEKEAGIIKNPTTMNICSNVHGK